MKKSLLTHGVWFAAAVASFVLGSQFFPSPSPPSPDARISSSGNKSLRTAGLEGVAGVASANSEIKPGGATDSVLFGSGSLVLSEQDIETLGEQLRTASNPIDRRLAFSRLLEGLTEENALLVRKQIEKFPHQSPEYREFHYAWGALAGNKAVLFGAETPGPDMAPALSGWASMDPAAARNWLANLDIENDPRFDNLLKDRKVPVTELRNHLMGGLVQGLADADPQAASEYVMSSADPKHRDHLMQRVAEAVLRASTLEEAAAWAGGLPEGGVRSSMMSRVAGHFTHRDPEAVASWASQLVDTPESNRIVREVGSRWAHRNPQAAVEWLEALPESDGRAQAFGSALGAWAGRNPEDAGQYINQMPASPERDSAINGYANRMVHENPAAAIQWANSVGDPALRERTLIQTGRVYFRRDHAAAREWLANSGLSPEARQELVQPKHQHDRSQGARD